MSDQGDANRGDPLDELIRWGDPEQIASVLLPRVRRIANCVLRGRDRDLIETAAGDAILAVCRHRAGFRGHARASTWIHTITRRAAIRCARRDAAYRGRLRSWGERTDLGPPDWSSALAQHPLTAREAIEILEEAVPNPAWRQLWLMWNEPEATRSHAEIASLNGYTPGSVAVILSHVRARIRAAHARALADR